MGGFTIEKNEHLKKAFFCQQKCLFLDVFSLFDPI